MLYTWELTHSAICQRKMQINKIYLDGIKDSITGQNIQNRYHIFAQEFIIKIKIGMIFCCALIQSSSLNWSVMIFVSVIAQLSVT